MTAESPCLTSCRVRVVDPALCRGVVYLLSVLCTVTATAQESRFALSDSRSTHVHWITLYDADGLPIDPSDENPRPYSPRQTCGVCHDYDAISHGFHFNELTGQTTQGRSGEPWIWLDTRSGTQIPLSYRGWSGTYDPRELGIAQRDFLMKFGRHFAGGGPGILDAAASGAEMDGSNAASGEGAGSTAAARRRFTGDLEVDCMVCHSRDGRYDPEARWEQIEDENFAWAATSAMRLAHVDGSVQRLPDDFDPEAEGAAGKLPQTVYEATRFNSQNEVFFDVTRTPPNSNCYFCHTTRRVGEDVAPAWIHSEDVHLQAGLACVDCHRGGIDHHIVRGYQGEDNPSGMSVQTLTCAGCHLPDQNESSGNTAEGRVTDRVGRFAPIPEHKGLPPLHFEKLSCTACHSGPLPDAEIGQVQTSVAHSLGIAQHGRGIETPPGIVTPVFIPENEDSEKLYPHKLMWPSFWGVQQDGQVSPLNPDEALSAVRRALRVRRDFTAELSQVRLDKETRAAVLGAERADVPDDELTDEERGALETRQRELAVEQFRAKLKASLEDLQETLDADGARSVFVSAGRAWRLDGDGELEEFDDPAAAPYAWKLAHDVRPARWSIGVTGCRECHSAGTDFFHAEVTALGPAPSTNPPRQEMIAYEGLDPQKLELWNASFAGRTPFKWLGFAAMSIVGLVLILYLLLGLNGLLQLFRGSRAS